MLRSALPFPPGTEGEDDGASKAITVLPASERSLSIIPSEKTQDTHNNNNNNITNNNSLIVCPIHKTPRNNCPCLKNIYEDDEVCRINESHQLEFGIVGKLRDSDPDSELKIFWTLGQRVVEERINPDNDLSFSHVRLLDRKVNEGDLIHVNQKRGNVVGVSWTCHAQVLQNGMTLVNIPCENLQPLVPYQRNQKLEYNNWIGTILNVKLEATVMFTSIRKTGTIDCSLLPSSISDVYQGKKISLKIEKYLDAHLRLIDDSSSPAELFKNELVIESVVLFVNVLEVEVLWHGKLSENSGIERPPPTFLSKGNLKKYGRVLGTMNDMDWENCENISQLTFQYRANEQDMVVHNGGGIEEFLKKRYFPEKQITTSTYNFTSVTDMHQGGNVLCTTVNYNIKVLRISRMLTVKWMSGKIDVIPACTVTTKHSYNAPLYQLVQKPVSLQNFSPDVYGVTLCRDPDELVEVQWMKREPCCCNTKSASEFIPGELSPTPIASIEPHFMYGTITAREIVKRSATCRVPATMFTSGWVHRITPQGVVIVYSVNINKELELYPVDVEATGIKVNSSISAQIAKSSNKLIRTHGLAMLRNAQKIFMTNLSVLTGSNYPDHFTLLDKAPETHMFYSNVFSVRSESPWRRATRNDQVYLTTRMNKDVGTVWVKAFRDRLDLFSVLMAAPSGTPYEGGVFLMDVQLIPAYPHKPPNVYVYTGVGRIQQGLQDLTLEPSISAPYSLMESLVALKDILFINQRPRTVPSSADSYQRTLAMEEEERRLNAKIILDVLDMNFLNVLNPPRLWATEIVNYFLMSFTRTKQRLHQLLDSSCTSDLSINHHRYPLTPVPPGLTQSILQRLNRFEELIDNSSY